MERALLLATGMRRAWRTAMILRLVVVLVRATPAHAEANAVGADLGFASAVGFAGVTVTRQMLEHARLEIGGGWGYSGWQVSVMPKLTVGDGRDRFVAGAGVSVAWPTDGRYASGHPVWLNVDVAGGEHRFASGMAVSGSLGVTGGLGGGQICVPPDGCEPQFLRDVTHYWAPQARVGVAYWF